MQNEEKEKGLLFRKYRREGDIGISKIIMDHLVYLPKILEAATWVHGFEDHYEIRSFLPDSSQGLEYQFLAQNEEAADRVLAFYKETMQKEALKVFAAYWTLANQRGSFEYTAPFSEIMGQICCGSRESKFNTEERSRFWVLSKFLQGTKLNIIVRYQTKKEPRRIILCHRLLDINALDDKENITILKEGEYPGKVQVKVLDYKQFEEKSQIATSISRETARLEPEDIMLALAIQTRASQVRDVGSFQMSRSKVIELSHLQKTNASNPRVAKKRITSKMDKFQEKKIVDKWSTKDDQYRIERKLSKIEVDKD